MEEFEQLLQVWQQYAPKGVWSSLSGLELHGNVRHGTQRMESGIPYINDLELTCEHGQGH